MSRFHYTCVKIYVAAICTMFTSPDLQRGRKKKTGIYVEIRQLKRKLFWRL